MSEDFERKLVTALGPGKTCPHGNAVGSDTPKVRKARGWTPPDEVNSPGHFQLVSVYERDRQLLEFLDGLQLRPSVCFLWIGRNYDETVTLHVTGRPVQVGAPVARRVWVTASQVTGYCPCWNAEQPAQDAAEHAAGALVATAAEDAAQRVVSETSHGFPPHVPRMCVKPRRRH